MATVKGILFASGTLGELLVTVDSNGLPDLLRQTPRGWESLKDSRECAPVARRLLEELGEAGPDDHTQQHLKKLVVLGLSGVTSMFFWRARW